MPRIIGGIGASHRPTIGYARDRQGRSETSAYIRNRRNVLAIDADKAAIEYHVRDVAIMAHHPLGTRPEGRRVTREIHRRGI
jgi:hypothetical protein